MTLQPLEYFMYSIFQVLLTRQGLITIINIPAHRITLVDRNPFSFFSAERAVETSARNRSIVNQGPISLNYCFMIDKFWPVLNLTRDSKNDAQVNRHNWTKIETKRYVSFVNVSHDKDVNRVIKAWFLFAPDGSITINMSIMLMR